MDLSTNFMGMKLKNPLILSSGPLTRNGEMMLKAIEAGVGAVVTETILNEVRPNVIPRLVSKGNGLQNIRLYSDFLLEDWEKEIGMIKNAGGVVIANILAHSPSEMAYLGKRVEKFGADAIELGISSPHGEGLEGIGASPEDLYEMVKRVVSSVKIPVMVKLSANVTNLPLLAKAAKNGGAKGLSAINTIRSIMGVDIETMTPLLQTYGGYSGDPIRPIGLASVATISQSVDLPISGIGGISSYKHFLEYVMLGADTCQIQTAIILKGYAVISQILTDLKVWMEKKIYFLFK
ncbi:MAG: hypothetical protein MJB14_14455, partial [Spirochaetes bacterium]|nr:hypothetical protein [Spirochaetota bacterium]